MDRAGDSLTAEHQSLGDERGFTLPELTIVIVVMGILFGIASSTWFGVVESRRVDSATNQVAADLRLAHTSATNRLTNWQVVLTSGSSSYQTGAAGALRTRNLPSGTEVYLTTGGTVTIVFRPDGSALPTGAPTAFKVRSAADGSPSRDIEINMQTARVSIV